MGKQLLDQGYGAGVVIAVGNALIQSDAQRNYLVEVGGAVLEILLLHVLLAKDDEAGIGAPVYQVVIAALQADGAQVAQENGSVVGVGADEKLGCPSMLVKPEGGAENQVDEPLGEFVYYVHGTGGGVLDVAAAVIMDDGHDFAVIRIHGFLIIDGKKSQPLLGLVGKLFFDHKGKGQIPVLVDALVADEPVHPGTKNECLGDGRADNVEIGILVLCAALVLLSQVSIQGAKIHLHIDVGFVVRSVGHDAGHDPIHGGKIFQPDSVFPVTPFSLCSLHFVTSVMVMSELPPIIQKNRRECNSILFVIDLSDAAVGLGRYLSSVGDGRHREGQLLFSGFAELKIDS